ncbi:YtxH domain-containing protein [Heyndrickxia sporothermodurans]
MDKKALTYGFIVGGIAGAISALLSAPSSGKDLRKQISHTKNEWMITLKEMTKNVQELKNSIYVLTSEGKDMAVKLVSDVKSTLSEWQNNIEGNKENIINEVQALKDSIDELELKIQERK